jgi:uncharacterized protein YjbI with pentapeptide repeats
MRKAAYPLYWLGWVLTSFSASDRAIVLGGKVPLLIPGLSLPAGGFFLLVPVAGFLLYAWSSSAVGRHKARTERIPMAGGPGVWLPASLSAALLLNAFVCLRMHESALSYLTGIAAILGSAVVFLFRRRVSAPRPRSWARKAVGAAMAGGFIAMDVLLVLIFIPWSLKGSLPAGWNPSPAGRPLRSLLYADLVGFRPEDATRSPGKGSHQGLDLRGVHLEGAVLRRADLSRADLRGAVLKSARMEGINLSGADLRQARLVQAWMSFADLQSADFSGADMGGCYLMGANLRRASLKNARLANLSLIYADAKGADFSGSDLTSAHLFGSNLGNARLEGAILKNSRLTRAVFAGADLRGADLQGANFLQADLRGASFEGANLVDAADLTSDQLLTVKALHGARMGPALLKQVQERCSSLLEKPAPGPQNRDGQGHRNPSETR